MPSKPFNREAQQVKSKVVPPEHVMASRAFQQGVIDAAMGEPFCKPYETWKIGMQQDYERRRQFSCVCTEPLLNGKKINPKAVTQFMNAYTSKIIR